jgi:hypothetical protein
MEITISHIFCWRSTNKGSFGTDMYGYIFHSFSVWYNVLQCFFFRNCCEPSRTAISETLLYTIVVITRLGTFNEGGWALLLAQRESKLQFAALQDHAHAVSFYIAVKSAISDSHKVVLMFRVVFWDILPCKIIVDRRFRGAYCLPDDGCSTHLWNIGRQ